MVKFRIAEYGDGLYRIQSRGQYSTFFWFTEDSVYKTEEEARTGVQFRQTLINEKKQENKIVNIISC